MEIREHSFSVIIVSLLGVHCTPAAGNWLAGELISRGIQFMTVCEGGGGGGAAGKRNLDGTPPDHTYILHIGHHNPTMVHSRQHKNKGKT